MALPERAGEMMSDPSTPAGPVTVWIPSLLRGLTGGRETVRVEGTTVRQVIAALDRLYPGIRDRLCDGDGLRPGLAVAVDSQLAPLGLLQPVPAGGEVHFLPAVSGG
jgi:molybdopterin synthase sulfur carrier subunit